MVKKYKPKHEKKGAIKSYRPSWKDRVGVDLGDKKPGKSPQKKRPKRGRRKASNSVLPPGEVISFFCDGSCFPTNPGRAGWSFVNCETGDRGFGGIPHGTNNVAELMGSIKAMEYIFENKIHLQGRPVVVFCDSQYVVRGAMDWLPGWKKNGWKRNTEGESSLKNLDLWKRISELLDMTGVLFRWVKGHNGNHWNEMCDRLAKEGASRQVTKFLPGKLQEKKVVARTLVVDDECRLIMSSHSADELVQENSTFLF